MAGISNNMCLAHFFYRFISENFANYIEAGDESVNYAQLPDEIITQMPLKRKATLFTQANYLRMLRLMLAAILI